MKRTKMPGMLCRSDFSTAVCVPGDSRSVILASRRPDRTQVKHGRLVELDYSRLSASKGVLPSGDRRRLVTLPMVTKREREPQTTSSLSLPLQPSNDHVFQVVVMRVSIHCQGCAGKVRKLISKMEGVTSFSIDIESKRVTVMGHVSPAGVLESISKVKKAEFWTC